MKERGIAGELFVRCARLIAPAAICFCTAFFVPGLGVHAAEPVRVVLLSGQSTSKQRAWPAAETAFLEELALLPFAVESVSAETAQAQSASAGQGDAPSSLLAAAAALHNARVAVMIVRRETEPDRVPDRVEVRLYEADSKTDSIKTWRVDDAGNPDAALIVGIRAAEAVRAAVRATEPAPGTVAPRDEGESMNAHPTSAPAVDSKAAEKTDVSPYSLGTPPPATRIGVGAGFSLGTSFENAGGYGGIVLALNWRPLRFGGVALDAVFMPWGPDVSAGGVSSRLDLVLFRAQAEAIFREGKRVRPAVGFGGGGLLVVAEGVLSDGRRLTKDLTKVGYLGGSVSVAVNVSSWMRLSTSVGLGASLPAVTLYHGETVAARLGSPLMDVSIRAMFGTD